MQILAGKVQLHILGNPFRFTMKYKLRYSVHVNREECLHFNQTPHASKHTIICVFELTASSSFSDSSSFSPDEFSIASASQPPPSHLRHEY